MRHAGPRQVAQQRAPARRERRLEGVEEGLDEGPLVEHVARQDEVADGRRVAAPEALGHTHNAVEPVGRDVPPQKIEAAVVAVGRRRPRARAARGDHRAEARAGAELDDGLVRHQRGPRGDLGRQQQRAGPGALARDLVPLALEREERLERQLSDHVHLERVRADRELFFFQLQLAVGVVVEGRHQPCSSALHCAQPEMRN